MNELDSVFFGSGEVIGGVSFCDGDPLLDTLGCDDYEEETW